MSAGSLKFIVRRIAVLLLVSLWLVGCFDILNLSVSVSFVNGNAFVNINFGMLITSSSKMGTTFIA